MKYACISCGVEVTEDQYKHVMDIGEFEDGVHEDCKCGSEFHCTCTFMKIGTNVQEAQP